VNLVPLSLGPFPLFVLTSFVCCLYYYIIKDVYLSYQSEDKVEKIMNNFGINEYINDQFIKETRNRMMKFLSIIPTGLLGIVSICTWETIEQ